MMYVQFSMYTLTKKPKKALNQSASNLSVNMSIHYPPKLAILHIVVGVVKFRNSYFLQHYDRLCQLDAG